MYRGEKEFFYFFLKDKKKVLPTGFRPSRPVDRKRFYLRMAWPKFLCRR